VGILPTRRGRGKIFAISFVRMPFMGSPYETKSNLLIEFKTQQLQDFEFEIEFADRIQNTKHSN